MRAAPLCLLAVVHIALLSMQATGLHLHVNVHGDAGGLHGSHLHYADPDGHDHSDELDVSVSEPGATWSKIFPFLVLAVSLLAAVVWMVRTFFPPPVIIPSTRRRSRWRPPLRAPPLTA